MLEEMYHVCLHTYKLKIGHVGGGQGSTSCMFAYVWNGNGGNRDCCWLVA